MANNGCWNCCYFYHSEADNSIHGICSIEDGPRNENEICEFHVLNENVKSGHYVVRRITPRECERLQGFPSFPEAPRDHTDIGDWVDKKGKLRKTTDAARYKALGNSMAVPCMRWIAQRIDWALTNPITENTAEPLDYQMEFGF